MFDLKLLTCFGRMKNTCTFYWTVLISYVLFSQGSGCHFVTVANNVVDIVRMLTFIYVCSISTQLKVEMQERMYVYSMLKHTIFSVVCYTNVEHRSWLFNPSFHLRYKSNVETFKKQNLYFIDF